MTRRGELRRSAADWVRSLTTVILLVAACDARVSEERAAAVADTHSGMLVLLWEIGGVDAPRGAFTGVLARERVDGSVLVVDPTAQELHFYSAEGTYLRTRTVGGDGPGEVRGRFDIALAGDTVFMFGDTPIQRQVGWLELRSATAGSTRLVTGTTNGGVRILGRLSHGIWLLRDRPPWRTAVAELKPGALLPESLTLGLTEAAVGSQELVISWLPRFETGAIVAFDWPDGPIPYGTWSYRYSYGTLYAVADRNLWLLDSRTGQLDRWRSGAEHLALSAPTVAAQPFDPAAVAAVRRNALASARTSLERYRVAAVHDARFLPAKMPLASALIGTSDGGVWIEGFRVETRGPRHYLALDSLGDRTGVYQVPEDVHVLSVGRRLVLASRVDEDGVEYVVAFAKPF